ncbi:hypothetical protein BDL97_04G130900 [Sphagnum fallax]|nr:hypothetical protein BDL97_04G130900 [Sphagnum fallax]
MSAVHMEIWAVLPPHLLCHDLDLFPCLSAHCVCNAFAVVAGKYVQQHCCIRTSSAQKNNIVIIIIIYHLLLHGILWWLRLHLCFCHQERLSASTDKNSWEGYND